MADNPHTAAGPAHRDALLALKEALLAGGLPAALAFLNQRVDHRFTAVYLLRDAVMHSVGLHDREFHFDTSDLQSVPIEDSFCQFVLRDGSFATHDSGFDRRLDNHRHQGAMSSYVGLPLSFKGRDLLGTFCHFDFAARPPLPEPEYAFMHLAARVLPDFVRPRPSPPGRAP